MIRLCIVLLSVTAISLGLAWIGDEPGRVAIDWAEYHIETSVLVLIGAAAVLAAACLGVYGIFYLLMRAPHNWARTRVMQRQLQGIEALTEAFAALTTQDTMEAKKQIARAQLLLPHQPLPLMIAAQVAHAEGNESQSRLYLEQMSKGKATGFLALRGLMESARRVGDYGAAVRHGEKAFALKPQDRTLVIALAGLYVKEGQMQQALTLLENAMRKRTLTREETKRLSAYVLYENAQLLMHQRREDFAIAVLEDALRRAPDFAPAAASLSEIYIRKGEGKRAIKALTLAWKAAPHPLLTDALLACFNTKGEHDALLSAAQKMARVYPDHRESKFLTAQVALHERNHTAAQAALQQLVKESETARACTLMAEVERASGDHEQAAEWLKRASVAKPEPTWVCGSCNHHSNAWQFICTQCGSVGSAEWK